MLTVLLFSGCAAPQQGQPGGEAPAVLSLWYTLQGTEADALEAQLQQLKQTCPQVIVKAKQVDEGKIVSLAYQAEAGGEGPDLYLAPQNILLELYRQGSLAPTAAETNAFPAAAAQFRFGDKLFALPWLTDVPVLVYRKDLTAPPVNTAEILQKGGLAVPVFDTAMLGPWWNAQGGKVLTDAGPTLNSPENLAFLQWMISARDQKKMSAAANAGEQFVSGQALYMITWASQVSQLNVPWSGMSLTDLTGGAGQILVGNTLGISNAAVKTNEDMLEAMRILEEALQSPEIEREMSKAVKRLPANVSAYQADGLQENERLAANALGKTWPITGASIERDLIVLQDKAWQDAWQGMASPTDALAAAQAQALTMIQTQSQVQTQTQPQG